MKTILTVLLLLVGITLTSFQNHDTKPTLHGIWVYRNYDGRHVIYARASEFSKDNYGFELKRGGRLVVRQNVGWCGTPPITYGNYNGKWSRQGDSAFTLKHPYWGGKIVREMAVVSITQHTLVTKQISYKTIDKKRL